MDDDERQAEEELATPNGMFATGLLAVSENLADLRATVLGHRNALMADGFSETACEQMAMVLHGNMVHAMFCGAGH